MNNIKLYKLLKEELDNDTEQTIDYYQSVIDNLYDELISGNLLIIPTEDIVITNNNFDEDLNNIIKQYLIISTKTKSNFNAIVQNIKIDSYMEFNYYTNNNKLFISLNFIYNNHNPPNWFAARYEYNFNKEFEENLSNLKALIEIQIQRFIKFINKIKS